MNKRESKLVIAVVALGLTAAASTPASAALLANPTISTGSPAFGQVAHDLGGFTSANVLDADQNTGYGTEYASNGQGAATFLDFDFGSAVKIGGMSHIGRTPADGITASTLTFSADAIFGNGDDQTVSLSHLVQTGHQSNEFRFTPVTARYVRWDVDAISGTHTNQGARYIRFHDDAETLRYTMTHLTTTGNFNGTLYNPIHAYDGDTATEWASNGQASNTEIDFDLGGDQRVGGFVYVQRVNDFVTAANLIFANDAAFTDIVATRSVTLNAGNFARTAVEFGDTTARYVRFDATSTSGGGPNAGGSNMYFVPDEITPVAALASTTFNIAQTVNNLINDNGQIGRGIGAVHANTGNASTMWHSSGGAVANEWLVFDLGVHHARIDGAVIWNHNQFNLTARGVNEFDILVSSDTDPNTAIWTLIGTFFLDQASGLATEPGQFLPFDASHVRLIRFEITSAHSGLINDYVGLSEVRFIGVVPAPAALPAGLALLGALTLRRRRTN